MRGTKGGQASPYFLDIWNLSDATFNLTEKAIVALRTALLIIAREIDISVAGIMASPRWSWDWARKREPVVCLFVAILGLTTGLLCGRLNGALVTMFRVPAIVATIGTMSLFRGMDYAILGDQVIKSYPPGCEAFGQGYVAGPLSIEFAILLGLAVVFGAVRHQPGSGALFGHRRQSLSFCPVFRGRACCRPRLGVPHLPARLDPALIAVGGELEIITMVALGGVSILRGCRLDPWRGARRTAHGPCHLRPRAPQCAGHRHADRGW
jgi:rhamnose transport system permease protein